MGGTLIWWLLGLGVAGGGIYVYTRSGEKKKKASICIRELEEPMFSQVQEALKAKDVPRLKSYAAQAVKDGYVCAAEELNRAAKAGAGGGGGGDDKPGPSGIIDPKFSIDKVLFPIIEDKFVTPFKTMDGSESACTPHFEALTAFEQKNILNAIKSGKEIGKWSYLDDLVAHYNEAGNTILAMCLKSKNLPPADDGGDWSGGVGL